MNNETVRKIIEHILKKEGGFIDHPDDVGGPTNMGITMPTLSRWLGRKATIDDIRNLDRQTTIAIYDRFYVTETPYIKLDDPWTFMYCVDMGVLHTPKSVAKIVQKAARPLLTVDGLFGPETVRITNKLSSGAVGHSDWRDRLRRERVLHYARRARDDQSQASFVVGWIKRAYDL